MNEKEKRRKFFYAMHDAGMYDATIEWVAPCYRMMHDMMLSLAEVAIKDCSAGETVLALDIGSGTGAEAIPLLQRQPSLKLAALDLCEPMNTAFRNKAAQVGIDSSRYATLQLDILETSSRAIRQILEESFGRSDLRVILSAFTLHHLDSAQKGSVYRMIHDLLSPGGVFISGDLFNFVDESPLLTQSVLNWELNWIAANFDREARAAREQGESEKSARLLSLKEKWLTHYLRDNNTEGIVTQFEMLRAAGFAEWGSPFRYWQVGLLFARKGIPGPAV